MKKKFEKKYKLTSSEFLLDDLDLEIDNDLFKQYYLQIQRILDDKLYSSLNYKKSLYYYYIKKNNVSSASNSPNFIFSLSPMSY